MTGTMHAARNADHFGEHYVKWEFTVSTLLLIHFYVSLALFYLSRLCFFTFSLSLPYLLNWDVIKIIMSYFPLLIVRWNRCAYTDEIRFQINFIITLYISVIRDYLLTFLTELENLELLSYILSSDINAHITHFYAENNRQIWSTEQWYLNTHWINQRYFISYSINAFVVNWTWLPITYNYPSMNNKTEILIPIIIIEIFRMVSAITIWDWPQMLNIITTLIFHQTLHLTLLVLSGWQAWRKGLVTGHFIAYLSLNLFHLDYDPLVKYSSYDQKFLTTTVMVF